MSHERNGLQRHLFVSISVAGLVLGADLASGQAQTPPPPTPPPAPSSETDIEAA